MPYQLTKEVVRGMLPRAPEAVVNAFASPRGQARLDRSGVTFTQPRMRDFFANIEHETGGFTIRNLTENTNYSAERMAAVWPNRFASADAVRAKFGTEPGWQLKAFDEIYGNRMGNRPGTHDGSTFIGRGGPQWTGRDGYEQLAHRVALRSADEAVVIACDPNAQPEVCCAFWDWKDGNSYADRGDFKGLVKKWNGGLNGWADRNHLADGNDPWLKRLENKESTAVVVAKAPGEVASEEEKKKAVNKETAGAKVARNAGAGGAVTGGGGEAINTTQTPAPPKTSTEIQVPPPAPPVPRVLTYGLMAAGLIVMVLAVVVITRIAKRIHQNWY